MKRMGFTVVELIISVSALAIFFLLGGMALAGLGSCSRGNSAQAEQSARAWGSKMGLDVQGADCVDADSDGDGYVSCSISYKKINGELAVKAVECAARYSLNDGCRMPKMTMPQQGEAIAQ